MKENTVATTPEKEVAKQAPDTRDESRTLIPPVDIFEIEEGLAVVADLPGVAKEDLDIRVENDVLTIKGKVTPPDTPGVLYREWDLATYHRQFQLSEQVDRDKIEAEMRHGVLTIKLPKVEAAKPKRIQVNVAS